MHQINIIIYKALRNNNFLISPKKSEDTGSTLA